MKKANYKYALGEILIVIIGISIAFSMNKCSDNSKDKNLRNQYLINLKSDIVSDKATLKNNLEDLDTKLNNTIDVLRILTQDSIDNMLATQKIFNVPKLINFNPKTVTYQTLINSGDFKLINEFELKTAIEKHYATYKAMHQSYERIESIQSKYLGPYFINNVDYEAFAKKQFGFKELDMLKNILRSTQGSLYLKIDAVNEGLKSCDSTIFILDKALNN